MQLDPIVPEDFEPLIGRRLAIETTSGAIDCELTEVRRLPLHSLRQTAPFALLLRGPLDHPLGQGTYRLNHPQRGPLDLFMVPIHRDSAGFSYEITFN
jgi:isocitrate dehydrogenase